MTATYDLNFVCLGNQNLFVTGKIKQLLWKKVDDSAFPSNAKPFIRKDHEKYPMITRDTFKFETEDLIYFVQMKILNDNSKSGVDEFEGRYLVV